MKRTLLVLIALGVFASPAQAITVKRAHREVVAYSDALVEAGDPALWVRHCHYRKWHKIVRCRVYDPGIAPIGRGFGGPSYVLRVTGHGMVDEGTGESVWDF